MSSEYGPMWSFDNPYVQCPNCEGEFGEQRKCWLCIGIGSVTKNVADSFRSRNDDID